MIYDSVANHIHYILQYKQTSYNNKEKRSANYILMAALTVMLEIQYKWL